MKKISILGCGWVGKTLKDALEKKGEQVHCLSKDIGMNSLAQLYACDVLIIATPPSSNNYLEVLDHTLFSLQEELNTQVIFLSSISFYDKKTMVVEAEKLMQVLKEDVVILRLGGLMGYERIAGKYTAGKSIENRSTNYVHRDDVVGIIEAIIEKNIRKETFDVVAPMQCMRKEIFTQNAEQFSFEETLFTQSIQPLKALSSQRLCEVLNYQFKRENVLRFWS